MSHHPCAPRHLYLAWAILVLVLLASACAEVTGPQPQGERPLAASGALIAAAVSVTPTTVSTTGIPLMELSLTIDGVPHAVTPNAINESNWVAGSTVSEAVLWRGGELERIYQSFTSSRANGVNDHGVVVGEERSSFGQAFAFRWEDGVVTRLPAPAGIFPGEDAAAVDVDNDGNILVSYISGQHCYHLARMRSAAVLRPPFTSTDFDYVRKECDQLVLADAISDGMVVGTAGSQGFRWTPDIDVDLIGARRATAIAGLAIGGWDLAPGTSNIQAVRWSANVPQALGTLGGTTSNVMGINRSGWVVGHSRNEAGETRAFLWRPGDGMIDLGTLGGNFSFAHDINDQGNIVGRANDENGTMKVVIWTVGGDGPVNQPPEIEAIISPVAHVGELFELTPEVTDPEGDPFTLTWSGEVPSDAVTNGIFSWTPSAGDEGSYEITVTATQDDDPTLWDSETFVLSVLPASTPNADLRVTLDPVSPDRRAIGDVVGYLATIFNEGPDPVIAELTVSRQFEGQSNWGDTPDDAVTNGIFTLDLGELAVGESREIPFDVAYHAFGAQDVTASVAGNHAEAEPADNEAVFRQPIDLPLSTAELQFGGLTVPGTEVEDGLPLSVVGVRVPATLIAGAEPGQPDWFVPTTLTPADLLTGSQYSAGASFVEADQFKVGDQSLPGGVTIPGALYLDGESYRPGTEYLPGDPHQAGDHFIPSTALWLTGSVDATSVWSTVGRRLFSDNASTNMLVAGAGDGVRIGKTAGGVLAAMGLGSAEATLALCAEAFKGFMGVGDAATFACGSLTVHVLAGEVVIELDDGTVLSIRTGAELRIFEEGQGGWDFDLLTGSLDDVTVTPPESNSPPTAVAGGPYVAAVGSDVALDGSGSSDPDGDPLTYEWRLSYDHSTILTATGPTPVIQAPAVAGLYELELTVTDPAGASSAETVEIAVFDPSVASVTGGGWFQSPAGAHVAGPTAEGKATFAFHVQYRKGRSTPDGHARLSFEAGGLVLKSDVFDWLVVGGRMARFRGEGHLEGRANAVTFEVVARDPDEIRVRIWDGTETIYDSGDVALSGGRIIIRN